MNEIEIKPSRMGREDPLIRVHVAYPRGGDTIVLRAGSVREAKAWSEAIGEAGRRARALGARERDGGREGFEGGIRTFGSQNGNGGGSGDEEKVRAL